MFVLFVCTFSLHISYVAVVASCDLAAWRTPSAGSKHKPGYGNAVPTRMQPGTEAKLAG